jgi:3-deoxy-D-manno-octulosonic-acid transferase
VQRAMRTIDPSLIVLGELEMWPNFIAAAKRRGIPIAVANARLSENSFRGYQRLTWLTRPMFESLSLVAAQDATYAQRFMQCGVPQSKVFVTGSLKFDNVNFDRRSQQIEFFRSLVGLNPDNKVWLVGSTQSPEERVAATAFAELKDSHPELRLIVVPRHPERFDSVYQELFQLGLNPIRRSQINAALVEDWRVLLVDTIGELRWWWGLADLALVGGSFGNRGGQNMLEPAAYGADVFFGPNTSNFRDISQLLLDAGAATRLQTLDEILPWIKSQLLDPEPGRLRGQKAQQLIRQHQGALAKTTTALQLLLKQRREMVS